MIDVADEASIERPRRRRSPSASASGGLAALVNNAGIGVGGPVELLAARRPASPARGQPRGAGRGHPGAAPAAAQGQGQDRLHELGRRAARDPLHGPYHMSKWGSRRSPTRCGIELRPGGSRSCDRARQHRDADVGQGPGRGRRVIERHGRRGPRALRRGRRGAREAREGEPSAGSRPSGSPRRSRTRSTARRPQTRYLVGRDAKMNARVAGWSRTASSTASVAPASAR